MAERPFPETDPRIQVRGFFDCRATVRKVHVTDEGKLHLLRRDTDGNPDYVIFSREDALKIYQELHKLMHLGCPADCQG